jgi:addiction module HigA family antidote
MASIIKRGKFYRAYVARRGYKRQSATFDTKAEAEAWAKEIEAKMQLRTYRDQRKAYKLTLFDALDRYERDISSRKKGARQEKSRIQRWQEHPLAKLTLGELRASHFSEYRDEQRKKTVMTAKGPKPKAENTIRLDLALISNLFTVARKEWGHEGLANPLDDVKKPGSSKKRERRISDDELAYLIKADTSKDRVFSAVLQLAIETAMRRSELVKTLEWRHIDLEARVAHLPDTKGGEPRNVPLSAAAVELLRGLPGAHNGKVFTIKADGITAAFGRARTRGRAMYEADQAAKGEAADPHFLVDVRLHDTRHEATSSLFERDFNVIEAAAVTGHRDLKTLQRYTHLSASKLARKLDAPDAASALSDHPHPGAVLKEHLPAGKSLAEVARHVGVPKSVLAEIIAGRARIDANLALRLEALGPCAEMWAELQALHDVAQARKARARQASEAADVIKLPTRRRASTK